MRLTPVIALAPRYSPYSPYPIPGLPPPDILPDTLFSPSLPNKGLRYHGKPLFFLPCLSPGGIPGWGYAAWGV